MSFWSVGVRRLFKADILP